MIYKFSIFLLLFFVFSFSFKTDESFDQDLGRHLKLGEIIWQTKLVPSTNLFSYTNPDFRVIDHHYLFQVLVYLSSISFGLTSILFFKLIILLLSVFLILKTVSKNKYWLILPIGFIFLHVLRQRTEARPEIFSFLFASINLYILEKFRNDKTKLIFLLPIVQLIWANTHIYFPVGFFIQGIYLVDFLFRRNKSFKLIGLVLGLSVLVSLITPNGLVGLLYPFEILKGYGYTIAENQTMFLLESIGFSDPNFLFVKICIGLIISSLIVGLLRKNLSIRSFGLSALGLGFALQNVRSFPYLFFISFFAVIEQFGVINKRIFIQILVILAVVLILFESFGYLSGSYYRSTDSSKQVGLNFNQSLKGGIDFVQNQKLEGPIFNNFDIGSYIIYREYPRLKVFVDGRPEAYPSNFFDGAYKPIQSDVVNWKMAEEKYNFKTIIFSHTDQTPWGAAFLKTITKNPNWKIVYLDDFSIVLVKNEVIEEKKIDVIDLDKLDPSNFKFENHVSYLRIGIFLLNQEELESAHKFAKKSLEVFPDSPLGNRLMAYFLSNQDGVFVSPLLPKYLDKANGSVFW